MASSGGHPKVTDVAVFGVPNEDLGEEVKAVVQAAPGVAADAELAAELIAFCREHLAHIKCPRSIDFTEQLPRLPTGKLYKRQLRDPYWADRTSKIAWKCKKQTGNRSARPVDSSQNHQSVWKSGESLGRPLAVSIRGPMFVARRTREIGPTEISRRVSSTNHHAFMARAHSPAASTFPTDVSLPGQYTDPYIAMPLPRVS